MVTKNQIESGLRELGLRPGDALVAHSSLSSFGKVDGGADAVVDALLSVLGPNGTLVVPTFTWDFESNPFDPDNSPSVTGAIPEAVRRRPNAIRSNHPSHSVAAIGPLADAITEGTEDHHPFGRDSALFRVLQANGKILQLGTDHTTNSTIHVAEEIAGVSYLDRQRRVGIKDPQGNIKWKWIRKPGCSQGFGEIEEPLVERGAISEVMIGKCRARLMTARAVVDAALEALRFDQEALLCDRPDCESCAEARAILSALETERQDRLLTELAEEEEKTRRFVQQQLEGGEVNHFDPDENYNSPN